MNGAFWFLLGAGMMAAVSLFMYLHWHKRQQRRLMELTVYLEAASCGKENFLTHTEDEFSLLEDEIYKTVSELRIAREQEQRAHHQQADNLADIAHQLKTPLTSMSLMMQLLSAEAGQGQQEYIERIDSQLSRLDWLTGSLLTMSRLDAGAVKFTPVSLCFEELAARAQEPMERLLEERGQTLLIDGTDVEVFCDPYWTAEALVNLIKNSNEHIAVGGEITVTAATTPLYQQITVEDNGSGFDSEELPHLFQRFFRGKTSNKNSIGIGLALCRGIIEGQGGIIRAENRTEGGARFVIRIYP